MSRLRLVYVTRRFRPLPGGLENVAVRMLIELARRGHAVHVVTPRWQPDWPTETDYAGVRVVRIAPPAGGCWGEARYARRLVATLDSLRERMQVAIVSGLRIDAQTVVGAARRSGRVVFLQPERPGIEGDCHWQIEARGGSRLKRRCYLADGFVALTALLQRELTAAGYARSRIYGVPLGVPSVTPTTAAQKAEARRSLAQADPALALPNDARLVVYVGRLRFGKGLEVLLEAWRGIVADRENVVLWLVGEGPDAEALRERMFELGLAKSVRLTGAFDDVEDVFRAADLAVYPSQDDGLGVGVLEAATYGLPIVAGDTVTHREFFSDDRAALLVPKHDAAALAAGLASLLDDDTLARQRGAEARLRVEREHGLTAMVDTYERLLIEAVARKPAEVRS
ncbi:MAG: glycosyltransferase family 4 protein [Planctomycetia bacterium]|nr:glycosyltransferase family 4 protein [Planctomycetia bacterium]